MQRGGAGVIPNRQCVVLVFESKGFVKNMWRDGLRNTPYSEKDRL